jgi:uncharacterized protein (DUF2147 family)
MKKLMGILGLIMLIGSPVCAGDQSNGIWKTAVNEETGGWLQVKIYDCDGLICGEILNAYLSDGKVSEDYEHKGKPIIWGMEINGDETYKKGKIWNPVNDKTYSSKLVLKGATLDVSGGVWGICQAHTWERVVE